MLAFFAHPFVLGFVLAYLWNMTERQMKGKTASQKAWQFAQPYFIVATIPGMYISYTSFQISALMVGVWTITGLLEAYAAGLVFAKT
ncbi:hypothetical protein A3D81_00415 [Candidatus Curtissbacteria bacterium RIFCSPHIGHO2_02_FULL_40_17]|uniref:Uncharacterized protein n=4 Tax=Microgenomates group TaxID=1794810 RepID=A0A1F7K1S4_9BACT|nr:MAG: hypothetical protein A3D81_00415 [Candidatus Curtissbacteria bacterium RIFCSPHIGHO2_02_FULL_40_17]OGK37585.1 MAG: hypothetical protein A3F32_01020 [Candidatus Roizmanbacteria bacterium RIFCSPHIGHO2_12_FULL_42_10]OGK51629.1 MAG: hypothetical protein A3B02_00645 [Candidatus Roizmanbacteria bacterium RIFCSPLOWO2_01_FULL_42_14]OGK61820.1 MAG: hypothetical protein A3I56_04200 [Candidatus Roizmanbacteria bacterium RIFCSPLOWO2_02_FULL_43_10]